MRKLNCWDYHKCGMQFKRSEIGFISETPHLRLSTKRLVASMMGVCPASIEKRTDGINSGEYGGRSCWAVSGSFCRERVAGLSSIKADGCSDCGFYKLVKSEEGPQYKNGEDISGILGG